jgi:hypothetical protein
MSEKYYKSIKQLPLENWFECSDGNYEYTRLNIEFGTKADDKKAWDALYNDFINLIGLDESFVRYIELLKAKSLKQLEFVERIEQGKRNRFLMNGIREITARIKAYEKTLSIGGTDKYELLQHLGQMQGYRIDPQTTKTIEYFKLIEKLKKQNSK